MSDNPMIDVPPAGPNADGPTMAPPTVGPPTPATKPPKSPKVKPAKVPRAVPDSKETGRNRQDKQSRADNVVPVLPRTSFNFIEATWDAHRKRRLVNVASSCAVALLMMALILAGLWAGRTNAALKVRSDSASAAKQKADAEIQSITGGVTDLTGHAVTREKEINAAYGKDVNTSVVLERLLTLTPATIHITEVQITGPLDAPATDKPTTAKPGASTTTSTTLPAAAAGPTYKLKVVAVSVSQEAAQQWRAALTVPGSPFTDANPTLAGTTATLELTLDAGLLDDSVITELPRVRQSVGYHESTVATPAASTTTTKGAN